MAAAARYGVCTIRTGKRKIFAVLDRAEWSFIPCASESKAQTLAQNLNLNQEILEAATIKARSCKELVDAVFGRVESSDGSN